MSLIESTPVTGTLSTAEHAVLDVLVVRCGRVVARRDLARLSGLADLSQRRCDSVLVGLRRALGGDSIVTVRSRGWMLVANARDEALRLLGT